MNWASLLPLTVFAILGGLIVYCLALHVVTLYLSKEVWTLNPRFNLDDEIDEVNRLGPYTRQRAMFLAIKYNSPAILNSMQRFGSKHIWNDFFNIEKNKLQAKKNVKSRTRSRKN